MSDGAKSVSGGGVAMGISEKDRIRLRRKTLEETLDQCQQFLQLLSTTGVQNDDESEDEATDDGVNSRQQISRRDSSPPSQDGESDMLCSLIKSRIECAGFLEKLESARVMVPHKLAEESSTWDMVSEKDLWEGGNIGSNEDEYVLVSQDDIVDGIACFMAAYLLSLEKTKDLTPNQLQDALSRTFSLKKKKGKLRKAWDGSKVIYNVASWGATAIGIYQNPVIIRVASTAFWTSCNVISKLL